MNVFKKILGVFHSDWCKKCGTAMKITDTRLYFLPMSVGNYTDHENADYYLKNAVPISDISQIPTGMYACRVQAMRCPQCANNAVIVCPFLPVRGEERKELAHIFENGEVDELIYGLN